MKKEHQKQTKQATPTPATASIEKHVVPQLIKTIALLRAEVALLQAKLEELKLSSVRAAAKTITHRYGIQTQ